MVWTFGLFLAFFDIEENSIFLGRFRLNFTKTNKTFLGGPGNPGLSRIEQFQSIFLQLLPNATTLVRGEKKDKHLVNLRCIASSI